MKNIHKVKKPFMCFKGQFEEGKHSLCIGIKKSVLMSKDKHLVQVGKGLYEIDCLDALNMSEARHAFYNQGDVAIVPFMLVSKRLE